MIDNTGIGEKGDSTRVGDWCWTHTNKQFYPLDPRSEDVDVRDIFWALSQQCRFAGHCDWMYSVLQHSLLVMDIIRQPEVIQSLPGWESFPHVEELQFQGLFHDATETYMSDLVRPLKRHMPAYKEAELKVADAIGVRLGLGDKLRNLHPIVHHADNLALALEARDLCGNPKNWHLPDLEAYPTVKNFRLRAMDPYEVRCSAYYHYLRLARKLYELTEPKLFHDLLQMVEGNTPSYEPYPVYNNDPSSMEDNIPF